MSSWRQLNSSLDTVHGRIGLVCLVLGEALIMARVRPYSDFYFPFVWLGYVLLLDSATYAKTGKSLFMTARPLFLALFPVSSLFWWIFELFNQAVHNWVYVGASMYSGVAYFLFASVDFSFVLPAVWCSALFLNAFLRRPVGMRKEEQVVPTVILSLMVMAGILCVVLPLIFPRQAFGLIWGSAFFVVDPVNHWLKRPSIIGAIWSRRFHVPLSFAFGALMCGFFWEAWNFWSMPKWVYTIPYVDHWHIFQMPLLGWAGYLPFGLELFAMANFVLPLLRLPTLTLNIPAIGSRRIAPTRMSS